LGQVGDIGTNSRVGAYPINSALSLNSIEYPETNTLEIQSDSYYNQGFSNFTININQ